MARIAADVTWLVGNTPLVELGRIARAGTRVVVKLEALNPSGSSKDRAALGMIRHAEHAGFLRAGGTIVECSSGDLGLSLTTIGRRLGYRVVLTMPGDVPAARRSLLAALGAELELTPSSDGMRGAMVRAEQLARQTQGAVCLQAFSNRANARAHAESTAREIWHDSDGRVGLVVVPVGTGGTAAGCAAFFREHDVPVYGVQPAASPVLTGGRPGHHDIPGIGAGFVPDILTVGDLAGIVDVTDEQARETTVRLLREESLLVGPASGAVCHAACELAALPEHAGKLVVAVLPDHAERYLEHAVARGLP